MSGCGVRVEGARFSYGALEALRGVDLAVGAGDQVALIGPNGAGKTTLTRLVVGLRRPSAGRVTVGDWDVAGRRPDEMARRVGYAFQHADQQLFARSVAEDVAFGPRCLGRHGAPVGGVLEELALGELAHLHPYDVPAPLRKLVALAGVLAMEPLVLILDEPTAGLDAAQRELVVAALARRARDGVTVLAVSHDLGFVAEACERVVVMRDGRIVEDRSTRELLYDRAALARLGLRPPATIEISGALGLQGRPVRTDEVVEAMRGIEWKEVSE